MLGIDNDTLQTIQHTAQKAGDARGKIDLIQIPNRRDGAHLLVKQDGTHETIAGDIPNRSHNLLTVSDVPDLVSRHGDQNQSSIWYTPTGVSVILDDTPESYRDDVATCALNYSEEFRYLQDIGGKKDFQQKELMQAIRTKLWDALDDQAQPLLNLLRKLTFATTDSGHGDIGPGRASYGTDIKGEIQSLAGDLQAFESLTLKVRLYDDPALTIRRSIRCVLEDDALSRTFKISPLAGEIKRAIDSEMVYLREQLSAAGVDVFYGSPE